MHYGTACQEVWGGECRRVGTELVKVRPGERVLVSRRNSRGAWCDEFGIDLLERSESVQDSREFFGIQIRDSRKNKNINLV